jgi:Spy/CpxP family protein refolding chaperone
MNSLKRSLLTLAIVAGCAAPALAQPPEHPPGAAAGEQGGAERGPRGGRRGDRLKMLAEELGLTEEQKTQLKPILAEEAAALKAISEDKALEGDARREKMKSVRESFAPKIGAILTPEQKAKFEKLKARRGPAGPRKDREETK